ncbi:hypothetical protein NPIL_245041 [Nephila pilipes]|uniref:Uncharacterized protein n=1 Tax=Nephila pilipes TaxID=299642 RepID=A0A8X6TV63_NEPPI|nr:hypothetical protein NPIL_245041 [Nephila pilipes]
MIRTKLRVTLYRNDRNVRGNQEIKVPLVPILESLCNLIILLKTGAMGWTNLQTSLKSEECSVNLLKVPSCEVETVLTLLASCQIFHCQDSQFVTSTLMHRDFDIRLRKNFSSILLRVAHP